MTQSVLTFEELHAALASCMQAHPPEGVGLALHADANAIAGVWSVMFLQRTPSVSMEDVKPSVLDAYRRWSNETHA